MTKNQPAGGTAEQALLAAIFGVTSASGADPTDPDLTSQTLSSLVTDPSTSVREVVASHPNLTETQVLSLSIDAEADVRAVVASRSELSEAVRRALATDVDVRVRRSLAHHGSDDLPILARDPAWVVAYFVAANPATPQSVLEQLALHSHPEVARRTWETRRVAARKFSPQALDLISPATLRTLAAASGHPEMFLDMAANWSASTDALGRAVADLHKLPGSTQQT